MSGAKILTSAELALERSRLEREGGKLVFTNGCFDLLHAGHVRYLQQARALGDALAVALNDDESVRHLKGATRPVNPLADRAEVLAALACVDYVTPFPGLRVDQVIREVRPHVYAKGGDYTESTLDPSERAALTLAGSRIEILPLVPGRSTTLILEAMRRGETAR